MADKYSLEQEAQRLNYQLRSTFFYRKLVEYKTLTFPVRVAELFPHEDLYDWSKRSEWGIGEDAFTYVGGTNLNYLQVFCHPKVLREHQELLAYYRNIAALPQKAVGKLVGIHPKKFEDTSIPERILNEVQALTFARLFNEHITLIFDSSVLSLSPQDLEGLLLASTGAQIDGSWRNKIGEEAERVVRLLLIKEAIKRKIVHALLKREKLEIVPFDEKRVDDLLGEIDTFRGMMLTNKTSIIFSSEPDVSLIAQDGTTIAVIEVKGGTDSAGALERYGAAKKSFEKTLHVSPKAKTIFISNSLTAEVKERLRRDQSVTKYFNLVEVLHASETSEQCLDYIFNLLAQSK